MAPLRLRHGRGVSPCALVEGHARILAREVKWRLFFSASSQADMKTAATIAAALVAATFPAHAESETPPKIKGAKQKTIVGPQVHSLQVPVPDTAGEPLNGVQVTLPFSRS